MRPQLTETEIADFRRRLALWIGARAPAQTSMEHRQKCAPKCRILSKCGRPGSTGKREAGREPSISNAKATNTAEAANRREYLRDPRASKRTKDERKMPASFSAPHSHASSAVPQGDRLLIRIFPNGCAANSVLARKWHWLEHHACPRIIAMWRQAYRKLSECENGGSPCSRISQASVLLSGR